jgi:hypothetical protein
VGSAFVVLFLLAADPGVQTGAASQSDVAAAMTPGLVSGLEVEASVESQSRAGETPIVAGGNSQPFVAELLIPRLALDFRARDVTLSAWYAPRVFVEDPTPPGTSGTLVLHTFGVNLRDLPSKAVILTGSAMGSIGEPDYTSLAMVLGTTQGSFPSMTLVEIASLTGQVNVQAQVTRLLGLTLAAQAFYWHWLDVDPATITASTITGQISGIAELGAMFRLTPLDAIGLSAAVGDASYSNGTGLATVTPAAIWKARLARREDLRVTLGVTYARAVGTTPPGGTPSLGVTSSAVSPIGSVDLVARITRRNDILFFGHVRSGVDFFLDPVLGTGVPRGFAGLELGATSVSGWTTGLRGDFATALRTTPYPIALGQIPPDETAFSVALSVRRQVSERLFAELGGRWADRGPALVTSDFQFHQRQLWVYLSVIGTTRPVPRAALPVE